MYSLGTLIYVRRRLVKVPGKGEMRGYFDVPSCIDIALNSTIFKKSHNPEWCIRNYCNTPIIETPTC